MIFVAGVSNFKNLINPIVTPKNHTNKALSYPNVGFDTVLILLLLQKRSMIFKKIKREIYVHLRYF